MNETPLPSPQDIREMLEMLLGREVSITTGADMPSLNAQGGQVVGVFETDPYHNLTALWVSDLPLSAAIGAAIGLLPATVAVEAAELGLTTTLGENVREAINVAGSLLNSEGTPHVVLKDVYLPGDRLPTDVATLVSSYVPRHNLKVVVANGYGEGVLSIAVR